MAARRLTGRLQRGHIASAPPQTCAGASATFLARMPPRPIASLAHALGAAPDLDAALLALGETLAELDRGALLALFPYDARAELLRERVAPAVTGLARTPADASLEHLPSQVRQGLLAGARFIELAD